MSLRKMLYKVYILCGVREVTVHCLCMLYLIYIKNVCDITRSSACIQAIQLWIYIHI